MFCTNCGKSLSGSETFCPGCGRPVGGSAPKQETPANYTVTSPNNGPFAGQPAMPPMKWYKFVIYFQLFAAAVVHAYTAFQYATGLTYGDFQTANMVFSVYPSLRALDYAMVVICLGLGVWAIVLRQQLAHFKAQAFPALYVFYAGGIIGSLFYAIMVTLLTGLNIFDAATISSLVISGLSAGLMILLSMSYFKKRMDLFH